MEFKENDWVIHDYAIKQVIKVEDGAVREVSCGVFSTSGRLECRPLTLRNKRIASEMRYWYDYISKLPGSNALNFPDINRFLVMSCYEAIDSATDDGISAIYDKVSKFAHSIENKMTDVGSVQGVRIFRN